LSQPSSLFPSLDFDAVFSSQPFPLPPAGSDHWRFVLPVHFPLTPLFSLPFNKVSNCFLYIVELSNKWLDVILFSVTCDCSSFFARTSFSRVD
jgi:hypothetical protein